MDRINVFDKSLSQQAGTLAYGKPPVLYKDNGKSAALVAFDKKWAKKRTKVYSNYPKGSA